MNFRNALGFFLVGALFALLPRMAPGLCGVDTLVGGSSTRVLWLQIMSFLQMGLGVSYFAQRTLVGLASLLEYSPQPQFGSTRTAHQPLPAMARPFASAVPALSPIRVAIKGGLMDQRRAA